MDIMVYKRKKKSYYKKLAIYALIAIPAYVIIASYYPDVFNFEQFGQEGGDYYFNSVDQQFSIIGEFDTLSVIESKIAFCETTTTVKMIGDRGQIIQQFSETNPSVGSWIPTLTYDLLGGTTGEKVNRIEYETMLNCEKGKLFPNVVLDSYDLKLTVTGVDVNGNRVTIDTDRKRSNSDFPINRVSLFKETIFASEIERKIAPTTKTFPTYINFHVFGDLNFGNYGLNYLKTLNLNHGLGGIIDKGAIGTAPLDRTSELIIGGGLVKDTNDKNIDITLRFKNWSETESQPKLKILFTKEGCNSSDCVRQKILDVSLSMYKRGNDGYASYILRGIDDRGAGTYEILATGGETVKGASPLRTNLKVVEVVLRATPTSDPPSYIPPITPTSGSSGSKIIEGEVQLGYRLNFEGGSVSGIIGKDAKAVDVAFSQLDLIASNEGGREGKVTQLKIEPHLTFPCTLKTEDEDGNPYGGIKCDESLLKIVSPQETDVTYTGTVRVDGKEDNINQKYLYADDRIYNMELSQCEKSFNYQTGKVEASNDCIQDFRIQPLTLGHTKLNDMVEDALCGEDVRDKLNCNAKKNEHDVKIEIRLDAEFELADDNMKGYAGLIQNVEYVFDFDYKPKKTSNEPRTQTPDPDEDTCIASILSDVVGVFPLSSSECQEEKRVCDNRNDGEWTEGNPNWFCKAIVTERGNGNGGNGGNGNGGNGNGRGGNGNGGTEPELPDLCSVLGIGCPEEEDTDTGSFVGVCEEGEVAVILSNGELVCKDEGTGEFVPEAESDSEVTTGNPPTGNDGQAGAGETDGGMTNEEKEDFIDDLGDKLEELDTGFFSSIPNIGFGGFSNETVWIFVIIGLIILFIMYRRIRGGYRNRQSYFGQMP